jgi:predicted porin
MIGGLSMDFRTGALAAALAISGFALFGHAQRAYAADLGGDCCADLEERVADLEATTVRAGTKKVQIEVYGKMNRAEEFWDDGDKSNAYTVNNGFESSRFGFKGKAQINSTWYSGFRFEIETERALSNTLNQNDNVGTDDLHVRHSYLFIGSDKYGELRLGLTSTAKDDIDKLAQPVDGLNDTITPDYGMNRSFFLRSKGIKGNAGLSSLTFGNIAHCYSSKDIFDCSTRRDGVAYWSPKIAGFQLGVDVAESDSWAVGLQYKNMWGKAFQVGADAAYEGITDSSISGYGDYYGGAHDIKEAAGDASVMHVPSGLYAMYSWTYSQEDDPLTQHAGIYTGTSMPDMFGYDIQGGWEKKLMPMGDSTFFGGYNNVKNGIGGAGGNADRSLSANTIAGVTIPTEITGAQVDHWYLGYDQGIDSVGMHLYVVYQHFDPSVDLVDSSLAKVNAPLDAFDLVYAGARIYF